MNYTEEQWQATLYAMRSFVGVLINEMQYVDPSDIQPVLDSLEESVRVMLAYGAEQGYEELPPF